MPTEPRRGRLIPGFAWPLDVVGNYTIASINPFNTVRYNLVSSTAKHKHRRRFLTSLGWPSSLCCFYSSTDKTSCRPFKRAVYPVIFHFCQFRMYPDADRETYSLDPWRDMPHFSQTGHPVLINGHTLTHISSLYGVLISTSRFSPSTYLPSLLSSIFLHSKNRGQRLTACSFIRIVALNSGLSRY